MQAIITKRNGTQVEYDRRKIRNVIKKALVYSGNKDNKLADKLADSVHSRLDNNIVYTTDQIHDMVEKTLMSEGYPDTAKAYILYRGEKVEIYNQKKKILNVEYLDNVAKEFSVSSLTVLESRYLKRNAANEIIETPDALFTRVATLIGIGDLMYDNLIYDKTLVEISIQDKESRTQELARLLSHPHAIEIKIGKYYLNQFHIEAMLRAYSRLADNMVVNAGKLIEFIKEGKLDKYEKKIDMYKELMTTQQFMPNSPTLYNAGAKLGQLSACFVLGIEDNLKNIMKTVSNTAIIFQSGGGVGINYSNLREEDSMVSSTSGKASGPVSFMEIIDTTTDVVKQGGKRRGANMGILNSNHPDIEKFIENKNEKGKLENFNVSVLIDDKFWEGLETGKYDLKSPVNDESVKTVNPQNLFTMIAHSAWNSAEPGLLFKDNMNLHNIYGNARGGPLVATNPCVTGDTRVYTKNGLVRIDELYKNQTLDSLALDSRMGHEFGEMTAIMESGKKQVYKLTTKEGYSVRLTADHKIMTTNGWKPAGELTEGDEIQLLDHVGGFGKQGNYDLGAVMGWLIGDGSFTGAGAMLSFWGDDIPLAQNFADMVNRMISDGSGNRKKYIIGVNKVIDKGVDRCEVRVNSTRLETLLKQYGIIRGDKHHVPDVVFQGTKETQKGFLRSLFSADGSIARSVKKDGSIKSGTTVRLSLATPRLLSEVQMLLLNFGIAGRIYPSKPLYEIIISKENVVRFRDEIGFLIKRKEKTLHDDMSLHKKFGFSKENFLARFEKLEKEDIEQVYDLTENLTHSFIANGMNVCNCSEQNMYPNESCNLGSINVAKFVKAGKFNWDKYADIIRKTTRFLDNIMDVNNYPLESIEKASLESRRIGLGVMGVADALYMLKLPYNSKEGLEFMSYMSEALSYYATLESIEIAKERGSFTLFKSTEYPDGKLPFSGAYTNAKKHFDWKDVKKLVKNGVRNVLTTTVAPTGSISMIADCSSGMEPTFALAYDKKVTVGNFTYINKLLKQACKVDAEKLKQNEGSIQKMENIPDEIKRIFVVAGDINWKDHLKAQAVWQDWIGNAISKTINMPHDSSVDDVKGAYLMAHDLGLKGITVYRDQSRHKQVLNTKPTCECGGNIIKQDGCSTCQSCGKGACAVA